MACQSELLSFVLMSGLGGGRSLFEAAGDRRLQTGRDSHQGSGAGIFVVPVQVYLQQAPSDDMKGCLLGVQNLVSWLGIFLSAVYIGVGGALLKFFFGATGDTQYPWLIFVSLAACILPICLFYRLPQVKRDFPTTEGD